MNSNQSENAQEHYSTFISGGLHDSSVLPLV